MKKISIVIASISLFLFSCGSDENTRDKEMYATLNSALLQSTGGGIEDLQKNIPLSGIMADNSFDRTGTAAGSEIDRQTTAVEDTETDVIIPDAGVNSGEQSISETENADTVDGPFYTYNDDIIIKGEDGVCLPSNVFVPTVPKDSGTYPAVILVHSWGFDEHQYDGQAKKFADNGYIVLRYTARGWGKAGGLVNTFGSKDVDDLRHVLDWLEANTPVDRANIGMAGISYGGIMSLMGLSLDNRVKTAACLNGGTDLIESLYGGETPRLIWGALLTAGGIVLGRLDPTLIRNFADMLVYNVFRKEEILEWGARRSPITYINNINAANKPVYIIGNWHDNLFQAGQFFSYYEKLTSPKKIDFRPGIHGIMAGDVWNNVYRWMDHWLKGEDNGIMDEDRITMTVKNTGEIARYREWPTEKVTAKRFYLSARGTGSNHGALQASKYSPLFPKINIYFSGVDTVATTGVPILSEYLDSVDAIDVYAWLPGLSSGNGIYYQTDSLSTELKLRGRIRLMLQTTASLPHSACFVYLYDINTAGVARLITHGTFSYHEAIPFVYRTTTVDLVPAAWNIRPGHKLAVAIDTVDLLYAPPTLLPYSVQVLYSYSNHSHLTLDIEN